MKRPAFRLRFKIPPLIPALLAAVLFYCLFDWRGTGLPAPARELSVTAEGQPLSLDRLEFKAPVFFGLAEKPLESPAQPRATVTVATDRPRLQCATPGAELTRAALSDPQTGQVFFNGSLEEFAAFTLPASGEYLLQTGGTLNAGAGGHGVFYFSCRLLAELPLPDPVAFLSAPAAAQGELAVLTVQNLPEGVLPTAESELGYIRFLPGSAAGEFFAPVPVGYLRAPGSYPIELQAGEFSATLSLEVTETAFEEQQMTISEEISDATVNSQTANWEFNTTVVPLYDTANNEQYWSGPFLQPVEGRISTPYGVKRYVNGSTTPTRHGGVDIAVALGTPIQCPAGGVVEYAGFLQLSGNTIVLEHGGGLKSYFYHMDSLSVATGDRVTAGQLLGQVGTTGYSTGPHLHYEVKIGRESLNPWLLFDGSSALFTAPQPGGGNGEV